MLCDMVTINNVPSVRDATYGWDVVVPLSLYINALINTYISSEEKLYIVCYFDCL